jgi:alpha/beta superfamily hydrolase
MLNATPFPRANARFVLPGPVGMIEVATAWPEAPLRAGAAIVCHPHPLYGGTMDNKVVTTLERLFTEFGLPTLRFNFRGVGKSEGAHDHGDGEGDDLAALVAWLRAELPGHALWLAGFSFGSFVSARRAPALRPAQLISIAPPVEKWSFASFADPGCPWTVVQGEDDDVAAPEPTYRFVASRTPRPRLIRMPATGHFFHGKLGELKRLLGDALAPSLPPVVA